MENTKEKVYPIVDLVIPGPNGEGSMVAAKIHYPVDEIVRAVNSQINREGEIKIMESLSQENKGKVIDALTDIIAKAQTCAEMASIDFLHPSVLDTTMRDVIALAQFVSSKCYQPEAPRRIIRGVDMTDVGKMVVRP